MTSMNEHLPSSLDDLAVLAGAGISMDAPSNLPGAEQFLSGLFGAISALPGQVSYAKIEKACTRGQLRFERIIAVMQNYFDLDLTIVDVFGLCRNPGYAHRLLFDMMQRGCTVCTTNFDSLIELAGKKSGCDVYQAIAEDDYATVSPEPSLYKLHGSCHRLAGDAFEDTKETVCATLEAVGRQGQNFSRSPNKRHFFTETLKNKDMLVVGYSGGDDFDIMPLLEAVPSEQKITWVEHTEGSRDQCRSGQDLLDTGAENAIAKALARGLLDPGRVTHLETNTRTFLERVASYYDSEIACPQTSSPVFDVNLHEYFSAKLAALEFTKGDALFLRGALAQMTEEPQLARESYLSALDYYQAHRDRVRISQVAHAFGPFADQEKRAELAEQAVRIDSELRLEWHSLSLAELASVEGARGNVEAAIRLLEDGVTSGMQNGFAYGAGICLMNLGEAWNRVGNYQRARACLLQAERIFENDGWLYELAYVNRKLATASMEVREFDEAELRIRNAGATFEKLFEEQQRVDVLQEKGILLLYQQEWRTALGILTEVITVWRKLRLQHNLALALYNAGICLLFLGRIEEAISVERESSEMLIELNSEYYYAHNLQLQGLIEWKLGRKQQAVQKLTDSIRLSERNLDQTNVERCSSMIRAIQHGQSL